MIDVDNPIIEQYVLGNGQLTNGKIERFKHYPDPDEGRVAAERLAQERVPASD